MNAKPTGVFLNADTGETVIRDLTTEEINDLLSLEEGETSE
jgi:hypothetical protein